MNGLPSCNDTEALIPVSLVPTTAPSSRLIVMRIPGPHSSSGTCWDLGMGVIWHRFAGDPAAQAERETRASPHKIVTALISTPGRSGNRSAQKSGLRMLYRLRFIDAWERAVRISDIEAPTDERAVELSGARCVGADMPVELYKGDRQVVRITPMTARLYLLITTDIPA